MGTRFELTTPEHWWCLGIAITLGVITLLFIVAYRTGEKNPFKRFYDYGGLLDNLLFYGLFLLMSSGLSSAFYVLISFGLIIYKYF